MELIFVIAFLYILTLTKVKPHYVSVDLKFIKFIFKHNKKDS